MAAGKRSSLFGWTFPALLFILICTMEHVNGHQKRINNLGGSRSRRSILSDSTSKESSETGARIPTKYSSKIKYQPFVKPTDYNQFQIPSIGYLAAQLKGFPDELFDESPDLSHLLSVTFRIRNVLDLDEMNEEVDFAADLVLEWGDAIIYQAARSRLNISDEEFDKYSFDHLFKTLDPGFLSQIWKPDVYIENLVKVHHPGLMGEPVTVRLNEINGQIIYISRLRIKMECEMDFHYYPADKQRCKVVLRSNSYSNDELNLEWAKPYGVFLEDCGGPNFDYQLTDVIDEERNETYIGNQTRPFSVLGFTIVARRKLSYHMVQTFLPSVFFIIITWLCFLVPFRMVEARIGIAMTTLLTLTAMFASVRESSPTVSYVRAIDIWMVACIFFVFLTLLEFTVLLWLRHKKDEAESKDSKQTDDSDFCKQDPDDAELKPLNTAHTGNAEPARRKRKADLKDTISDFIENYAFLMFSIIFCVFCTVYWAGH